MYRNQKISIAVGIVLVIISTLFPSYEIELFTEGTNPRLPVGNHFIFSPPVHFEENDFSDAFGYAPRHHRNALNQRQYRFRPLLSQVVIQLLAILIVTTGATLIFGKTKESNSNPML